MELAYLRNGQACYVKEKIGGRYVINKIFHHEQFNSNGEPIVVEFIDEDDIIVDAIFKSPPVSKISTEIDELTRKKDELQNDIRLLVSEETELKNKISSLKSTQITQNTFILNKTDLINATNLALFPKDQIMPKLLTNKNKTFRGLKLIMELSLISNEERYWGYQLYLDENYSSSHFLCPKYGFLINPTEEEIEETIKKRLLEFTFSDYNIARVDDKYLTPEQLDIKYKYLSKEGEKEKKKLIEQLNKIQKELEKLETKTPPPSYLK